LIKVVILCFFTFLTKFSLCHQLYLLRCITTFFLVQMFQEANIAMLTEDQTNQLLSSFWIQANQTDNTPFNYEAIGHSYSLTVLSSRLKNSSNSNIVQFFQLPLSLRSIALTPSGVLPASCQRSIFILSTSMLAFTGKVCHITELSDLLRCFTSPKVSSGAENSMIYVLSHETLHAVFIFYVFFGTFPIF